MISDINTEKVINQLNDNNYIGQKNIFINENIIKNNNIKIINNDNKNEKALDNSKEKNNCKEFYKNDDIQIQIDELGNFNGSNIYSANDKKDKNNVSCQKDNKNTNSNNNYISNSKNEINDKNSNIKSENDDNKINTKNFENKFNNIKINNNKIKLKSNVVQNLVKNFRNKNLLNINLSKKHSNKNINEKLNINNINDNDNGKNMNIKTEMNNIFDNIIIKREEINDKINIKSNSKSSEKKVNIVPNSYLKNQNKNNYLLSYINKIDETNRDNKNNFNQCNTDNELTKIPSSNKPFSNRISKLNLDIFTTKKENNSKEKMTLNIKSPSVFIERRNGVHENETRIFNGIENDDNINGINRENLNTLNENYDKKSDEEMGDIKINNTNKYNNSLIYRRLNTDLYHSKNNSNRNANIDRCNLLRSNKNLTNNKKTERNKKNLLSNTVESKNPSNKVKKLKNQFPLFFNNQNYSVNNDNLEYTNNSKKKKANKLLIKNMSNSKVKIEKKKPKDILNTNANFKYLDVSYFNKYNTTINKNNNNFSTSVIDDKLARGLRPPLPLNNALKRTKEYNQKQIINNRNESYRNNSKSNSNKKQKYNSLKCMNNQKEANNNININTNAINQNINKLGISNTNYDVINFDENDNDVFYNNFFDDKSNDTINNEIKKLLEKNLNYSPNLKLQLDPQKIFAQGIMESFCYFKILDKDSPKFNPLDSCAVNPEALGYCEGYISIDVILGHLKITPKKTATDNFKGNNTLFNSRIFNNENNFYKNLFNNGKNNYLINNNLENDDNSLCLRIELKDINGVKIKKHMQDIMKIHKIFLKYNSHSGMEYEDNNGRIKKRVLSINKLIYMKEITEINMDQNEKIKAALCNFFAFTLNFGNNKINKVECIFINFEQFNIWNKCLETIAENNNKSKNSLISSRSLFHRKYNSNNKKIYSNGSGVKDNYINNH